MVMRPWDPLTACVQEDVAPAEHVSYLIMWQAPEQLDSAVEVVFFHEFLQVDHPCAVAAYNEVDVFELRQDLGYYSDQEVDSLPVLEPGNEDDVDLVWVASLLNFSLPDAWVRRKFLGVHRIRNRESLARIVLCSQNKVVFASMADTDGCVQVSEGPGDQLIQVDPRHVVETEQGVLCEDGLQPIGLSSQHHAVLQDAGALMSMDYVDVLTD